MADAAEPTFIDAFAGCGGLSLGLLKAGWQGLFAIEKDRFAFDTLKHNLIDERGRHRFAWPGWLEQRPWTIESLMDVHADELDTLRGKVDLLAGGPPCQGFSSAGRRRHGDPRNELVERYLEFVDLVRPKMILIENVRGITYSFVAGENAEEARNFANDLIGHLGQHYHVYTETIRCFEFGVPQQRPRFFLVGLLKAFVRKPPPAERPFARLRSSKIRFLTKRGLGSRVNCKQAISDLERVTAGTGPCQDSPGYLSLLTKAPETDFQRLMRDGHAGVISDTRLAQHRPYIIQRFEKIIQECGDAGRVGVQLNREMRERHGINKIATCVLDPAKPSPTITSMPDDLLHYSEPRTLTVRENARLQTFPDWFAFRGKYTTGGTLRTKEVPRFTQVANAVPPLIAEMWGEVLLHYALAWRKPIRDRFAA